jgi:pimeloyl-ACP methyl ester carboxylesterase
MGSINIAGTDWYYQQTPGQDRSGTLVFIHGSGGSHEQWSGQMALGCNSIALDLPGHGQSGGEAFASIGQAAAGVEEFLTQLQLPHPLYLVGHSMGAAITLDCALHYPELLEGIILLGAGQRMKVMPALLDALRLGLNDPEFISLGFSNQAPAELVAAMVKTFGAVSPAILYADFSACNDFDMSQELAGIDKPTLVIAGVEDKLTPLKLADYVASHIPNARLEVIPSAGHFVMLEKSKEVNRLIQEFCF